MDGFPCLFRGCAKRGRQAKKWGQKNLLSSFSCPLFLPVLSALPCPSFFNVHATILSHIRENLKPMVGFSARFFLEGKIFRKILADNDLQTQKTTKT